MSAIAALNKRREDLVQHLIVYEGPEQFEVTFTWLMHTGQDRVHDTKGRLTSDASFCNTISGLQAVSGLCRRL